MDLTAYWAGDLGVQFHLFLVVAGHPFQESCKRWTAVLAEVSSVLVGQARNRLSATRRAMSGSCLIVVNTRIHELLGDGHPVRVVGLMGCFASNQAVIGSGIDGGPIFLR